jgi:hypothetical protein
VEKSRGNLSPLQDGIRNVRRSQKNKLTPSSEARWLSTLHWTWLDRVHQWEDFPSHPKLENQHTSTDALRIILIIKTLLKITKRNKRKEN